jgi:hypothetical protein
MKWGINAKGSQLERFNEIELVEEEENVRGRGVRGYGQILRVNSLGD